MSDISATIDSDKAMAATLPDINTPGCTYEDELLFTITAFKTYSFRDLFNKDTLAKTVFIDCVKNVGTTTIGDPTKFGAFSSKLSQVKIELEKPEHATLTFGGLVEMRLLGNHTYKPRIDAAIEALVPLIRFPLFTAARPENLQYQLSLLRRFVRIHAAPDQGGLGNLTWEQLFRCPAEPNAFSVNKINDCVKEMQGYVLPIPKIISCTGTALLGANECCSNNPQDGDYRRCIPTSDMNCTPCGTHCCIAGVQWCP